MEPPDSLRGAPTPPVHPGGGGRGPEGVRQQDELRRPSEGEEALRERFSRPSRASLRTTEDLDPKTVLRGVAAGPALVDRSQEGRHHSSGRVGGQLWEFVTLGLTPEEHWLVVGGIVRTGTPALAAPR